MPAAVEHAVTTGGSAGGASVRPNFQNSSNRFGWVFLATVACWGLVFPAASALLVNRYDEYDVNFIEGLYARKEVAAARAMDRAAGGPRLIILGGSGALFGIDAELLEAKLGIPTINLATHAGLGGAYILDRGKRELHRGDRVLLCLEYQLWEDNPTFDQLGWDYFMSYDKRYLARAGWRRSISALYSIPPAAYLDAAEGWNRRRKGRHRVARGPYNVATLGPSGDMRVLLPPTALVPVSADAFMGLHFPGRATYLHEFAAWVRANDIRVYFTCPNHLRPEGSTATQPPPVPAGILAGLEDTGFVMLDTPAETTFPREWFMDTVYHTDPCARRVRSEELVRRLRPHFNLPPVPVEPTGLFVLAGGNHRPTRDNTFADDPGVRAVYLSSRDLHHRDAITPDGLLVRREAGVPVYYEDPEVEAMVGDRGGKGEDVARKTAALGDWFTKYNQHVFLIVRGAAGRNDPGPGVPSGLREALGDATALAAIVGTGRYAGVRRIRTGEREAIVEREWMTSVTGRDGPDFEIRLRADARATEGSGCELVCNALNLVAPGTGNGPFVAVVDPEAGIVIEYAAFSDPGGTATRHLWRLVRRR